MNIFYFFVKSNKGYKVLNCIWYKIKFTVMLLHLNHCSYRAIIITNNYTLTEWQVENYEKADYRCYPDKNG